MENALNKTGLINLCAIDRTGVRGLNAETFLNDLGLPIPASPNQALSSSDGACVLRLSQKEFWILENPVICSNLAEKVRQAALPASDCYRLFCRDGHAWFALTGDELPNIMAKICGVDMRAAAFPLGSIAQTSVARLNAIVVHHQINGAACFSVLCDSAAAEYMSACLLDAMQEFSGIELALPSN